MQHNGEKKLSLFWSVLAGMYLVLAIVSLHTAQKAKAKLNSWSGDAYRLL